MSTIIGAARIKLTRIEPGSQKQGLSKSRVCATSLCVTEKKRELKKKFFLIVPSFTHAQALTHIITGRALTSLSS